MAKKLLKNLKRVQKEEVIDPQKEINNEIKQNKEINKDKNKYNNNYLIFHKNNKISITIYLS